MRRAKAFTLIELLIVIAIIALLMAILVPAFQRVSREAKAVGCRSKLKHWGILFSAYVGEHDGAFFPLDCDYLPRPRDLSYSSIRHLVMPYFPHTTKLMLCPMTPVRPGDEERALNHIPEDDYGGTYTPYCFEGATHWDEGWDTTMTRSPRFASYGLNWCVRGPPPAVRHDHDRVCPYTIDPDSKGHTCTYHFARKWCWRNWQPEHPDRIPVLLDSRWYGSTVTESLSLWPPKDEEVGHPVCVNRHDGYVNGLFMDASVRKIGLKELWTLKWNPHFDTANEWTKAGHVRPEDWPQWMWKFKDY